MSFCIYHQQLSIIKSSFRKFFIEKMYMRCKKILDYPAVYNWQHFETDFKFECTHIEYFMTPIPASYLWPWTSSSHLPTLIVHT